MTRDTSLTLDIFDGETDPIHGGSLQVEAVRALIAEIREKGEMTAAKQVLCANALRLAQMADTSRSAIAAVQAMAQLTPLVEKLTDTNDTSGFTPEMKALIHALTVDPASYANPEASNPAEPESP